MIHPLDRWARRDDPVRAAVVGLGYWGPNLVRNLHEHPDAEVVAVCDFREEAARHDRAAVSGGPDDDGARDDPRRRSIEAVAIATPVSTHFALASRGAPRRQARLHREAARRFVRRGARPHRAGRPTGPRADAGPHVPVQPSGQLHRATCSQAGELGEIYFVSMSRVNLGLHQSDVSVAWDLGPHDFSILRYWLGETPQHVERDQPRLHHPDDPRRGLHRPRVRVGHDRPRRALLARAEQAASDDDRRLAEDARLRRHEHRAGPGLRLGRACSRTPRSSASTSSRTGRATSSRRTSRPPSRCCSRWATSAQAIRHGRDPALVRRARARGRPDDRGGRSVARARRRTRATRPRDGRSRSVGTRKGCRARSPRHPLSP